MTKHRAAKKALSERRSLFGFLRNAGILKSGDRKKTSDLKDMVKDFRRNEKINIVFVLSADFYDSREWREVRYLALKKHGGSCQCCGARASEGSPLHVDHIKPRSRFPEMALDVNNLQVLCKDCNIGKGAWDHTDWRT